MSDDMVSYYGGDHCNPKHCDNYSNSDLLKIWFSLELLKKEIDDIEKKLDNPNFGLEETKREIRGIEDTLKNPCFGLAEIKAEVAAIEGKLDRLRNKLNQIINILESPTFGLAEIKTEVAAIETAVLSPTFGLAEIKNEISAIASSIGTGAGAEIARIEAKLDSPTFGLSEIKTEVAAIETAVLSPTFGLAEIKNEIFAMINSPTFGLIDIKAEILQILSILGAAPSTTISTGMIVSNVSMARSLVIKLYNSTNTTAVVTYTVFDLTTCPKSIFAGPTAIPVLPKCTQYNVLAIPPGEYEIVFTNVPQGVCIFTGARENTPLSPIDQSIFLPQTITRPCDYCNACVDP